MKIGTRVKIQCPVYFNGKTHFGVVSGKRASKNDIYRTTYLVTVDGRKKSTAFSERWVREIK